VCNLLPVPVLPHHAPQVVGSEGCLVRLTPDLDSEVVATLETGTVVEIAEPLAEHADHPLVRSMRRSDVSGPDPRLPFVPVVQGE
jgi:hypothetical protein